MNGNGSAFFARLKQRKLVQWALAYVAFAFALLQGIDIVASRFDWPASLERYFILALVIGFFVVLVLAWYHGERGVQRVGGTELLIIALLLAIGGVLIWRFGPIAVHHGHALAAQPASVGAPAVLASTTSAPHAPAITADAQPIPAKSVAVLPFENLSADKGNAYFADGMQDLILTKLADIGDLKVIARTSTMQYGAHPQNLTLVGQQLGVATILEGSVQKAGNQVLINVQLIDAKTDAHLWAQSYQRTLDNIFGVEGEVAQKIADALKAKLTAAESARVASVPTTNTAAYNAFLQGQYYFDRGISANSKADFLTAFDYYRQAVSDDPKFALAWARLASSHLAYFHFIGNDQPGLVTSAKAAIERAFALQPNLAEAYLAQGSYRLYIEHDPAGAAKAYAAAQKLKPQDAMAIFLGGVAHEVLGEQEAAIVAFQHASALDPRQAGYLSELAGMYYRARRYADAERLLKRALAIDPSLLSTGLDNLAQVYAMTGNLDAMQSLLDGAPASVKSNPLFKRDLAQYFIYRRNWDAARTALLDAQAATTQPDWHIECALGDVERLAGDPAKAQPYYQHCTDLLPAAIQHSTVGEAEPGNLGVALVHLGRTREALAEGRRGIADYPALYGVRATNYRTQYALLSMAKIQAQAGMAQDAVATLDRLFSMPTSGIIVSAPWLQIDPAWDPLRKDPHFQALLKKYADAQPATATGGAAHD